MSVGKVEIIRKVAEKTGKKRAEVKQIFEEIMSEIANSLIEGKRVAIKELGVFNLKTRIARKGRNPQTGEEIKIPSKKVIGFKPAKSIQKEINKKK